MTDAEILHAAIDRYVMGNSGWRHLERMDLHKIADKLARLEAENERQRKEIATLREIASAEDTIFDKLVP
jgi:hypothetical protein